MKNAALLVEPVKLCAPLNLMYLKSRMYPRLFTRKHVVALVNALKPAPYNALILRRTRLTLQGFGGGPSLLVHVKALLVGLVTDPIFGAFKLPSPAPSALEGVLGVIGLFLGYQLIAVNAVRV